MLITGAGIKYDPPALPTPIDLTGCDDEILAQVRRRVGA